MGHIVLKDKELSSLYGLIENGPSNDVPIDTLLSGCADPDCTKAESGQTVLYLAIETEKPSDARTLLKYEANPLAVDEDGISAFRTAVRYGNVLILKDILQFVDDINIRGNDGNSALYLAASLDLTEVVAVLLEHGPLSKIDGISQTALHPAAGKGHQGPLMAILQSGQNLDPRGLDDYTSLHLAFQSHSHRGSHAYSCTVVLLEAGADPNAHAAFHRSRGQARLDLVRKLRECGARLNVCRSDGITLLHLAANMGDSLTVEYLLNAGITPTTLGNRGQTPLYDCVRSRSIEQNEQYSRADLGAVRRMIKMIANTGSQAPFKPFAREVPISERMQHSELVQGADGTLKSRNIKARMERFVKKRQEDRAE